MPGVEHCDKDIDALRVHVDGTPGVVPAVVTAADRGGFRITDLLEPEWPEGHERVWGGWSETRGRLTPGTALFGADWEPR